MSESQVQVDQWCSVTRRMVILTLQTDGKQKGATVAGRPVNCYSMNQLESCNSKEARCCLKHIRFETGRKR